MFGLYSSTAALATTLTLATVVNCFGIGFQRGTRTCWQLVTKNAIGATTLTDMGVAVFEQEVTADLQSSAQFLSPRLYMNNGATAAAAAVLTIVRGSASKQTVEMRETNSLLPLA